ncbi:MAG TPA: hypothetical protein VKZ97_05035 [Flavobacteriaceae bacterium]|nr:hypothetical protein [Flavobacteriaceae bacterium]
MVKVGHAKFWIDEQQVLNCQFNNSNLDNKLEASFAKLYIEAIETLCDNIARPFLIDLRDSQGTFSSQAANLLAKTPSLVKLRISEAYVVNSINIKLLITSYKRLYDTVTPFEIFNDLNTAKEYSILMKN